MDYGTPIGTKIDWTPEVKLKGWTYLTEERIEMSKHWCRFDVDNDNDDDLDEIKL